MEIKIISSNIRYDNPQDGKHSWEFRRPLLQKIFNEFRPDILGTQEGREAQIKDLARPLNLTLIDFHRSWIKERMYPCLFINEAQFQINQSGDIWLSETPHISGSKSFMSTFPRLCTWAHITHLFSDQEYIVVNTHLDHVLEETRINQIQVLINEVTKINIKNLPIILLGDFNDSPTSLVRQLVLERFNLIDPWIELALPEEKTHHSFSHNNEFGDRIDWVLIPSSFISESIMIDKNSYDGIFPSDHYPMLATVIPK